ncbi:hypothetical protein Agub_g950 [Astrephomene gubernaculifera]|uniref:Uncharacterized protein n=1 Tax=Astrephomene gubernaculifera TaxID=47775 RepID=A0AAD3HH34_9CHLO|nr:hypothetical protein Agub_g950 [Astrephomene gubernaculifera]
MSADILQQLAAATGMQDGPGKKSTGVKDEPARVLLVTTVDVGGGASERIEVRAGENPEDVARAFCQQHHLPDAIIAPLAAHLDENLRKAALSRMQQATAQPQDARTPQSGPDATDPAASGMLAPPQHSKSPQRPGQVATAPPCSGGAAPPKQPQYSFGTGMDDRLYEQLSSKLLDESQAPSARRGNWVSASEVLSGAAGPGGGGGSNGGAGSGMNSKRSSGGVSNFGGQQGGYGRLTTSAAPSPRYGDARNRDSVHMRLYATAQERAARQEERRRMANAEQVAAIAASRSSMSWISAEMMRGRGAGGAFDNYGEMLYAEGVESLMNRLKRAQLERKQREDQELEGVTFAPAITKKAWELKQRERTSCSGSMDGMSAEDYEKWQRLHLRGMSKCTQERLEQPNKQDNICQNRQHE